MDRKASVCHINARVSAAGGGAQIIRHPPAGCKRVMLIQPVRR